TRRGVLTGPDLHPTGLDAGFPKTGDVEALALAPTRPLTLYAGVPPWGVVKSVNDGLSFAPANRGLRQAPVDALALSPNGRLYTGAGFVHRSDDGGATWTALSSGPSGAHVGPIASAPPD